MSITIQCPKCSAKLTATDSTAGHLLKCPKCGGNVTMPAESAKQLPDKLPPPMTQVLATQEVVEIEQRLESLRRENLNLRGVIFVAGAVLLFGGLSVVLKFHDVQEQLTKCRGTLQTRRLEILDSHGLVRGVFATAGTSIQLAMYSEQYEPLVILESMRVDGEDFAYLNIYQNSRLRAVLGCARLEVAKTGDRSTTAPTLTLFDKEGTVRWQPAR